jgi:FAD/FMN-containing dehydrogenase
MHQHKVQTVVEQIRSRAPSGATVGLSKKAVSHFVPLVGEERGRRQRIDVRSLDSLLSIDPVSRTCEAEPGITFSELVQETLRHNLVPCVVPELKTITIGGAISGCSIESMSYRYGGFHDTCLEYEVVSGTGELWRCSRTENADLFEMLHGSYGTLGILTKVRFALIPAKPFVHLTYHRFSDFAAFESFMRERCRAGDYDFVDAIVHSPKDLVVCLGTMTDAAPYTSSYDWLNIFYRSTQQRDEDYLTTYDYYFRYDTECHWLTRTIPLLERAPVRFAFGKLVLGSTNLINWSNRLAPFLKRIKRRPDIVVDVFIPEGQFAAFFDWYSREFDYFPMWVVPYRFPLVYPWIADEHAARIDDELFIDCAIYGKPNGRPDIDYSEVLERKVQELGGVKTLISRNHYDEEQFWSVYSRPRYEDAKAKLDPRNLFGDLYAKMGRRN